MKLEGRGPGLFNAGGGTIELTDESVVINKKNTDLSGGGLLDVAVGLAAASKGGLQLRYDVIHAVNISEGGWTSPPFIQVLTPGETPVSDSDIAMRTPSCLLFKKAMIADFQAIKAGIEKRVAASKAKATAAGGIATVSIADEIAKLGKLMEGGLITQEEFYAKKKELLGM